MERESRELRTPSQSWPPGFFVGSVVIDGGARARRRDGLMLIALAVCGWCLGYAITDWVCDANQHRLAAASVRRGELDHVALHRGAAGLASGAMPSAVTDPAAALKSAEALETAALEAGRGLEAAALVEVVGGAAAALAAPEVGSDRPPSRKVATPGPRRARAAGSHSFHKPSPGQLAESEEPSPMVSPEELNKALTLAAASKKIFASLDEAVQPVAELTVLQPSAAEVTRAAAAASIDNRLVAIEALSVEGGVPSKVVSRGVQRLLPHYDRCRELCDTAPQRMKLSTTIDEAGHGRQVIVEGLSRPGLRRCLEKATAHLVVPAPDTGTARARWIVRFASR